MLYHSDCWGFYIVENEEKGRYVTRLELYRTQQDLRKDVTYKIDEVDSKVDTLNAIVLPLVESSRQTAENTNKMANSLDKFTDEQRKTNGKFHEKFHEHDLSLTELGRQTKVQTETKKANATIVVAIITTLGALIVGIFNLAPIIFG